MSPPPGPGSCLPLLLPPSSSPLLLRLPAPRRHPILLLPAGSAAKMSAITSQQLTVRAQLRNGARGWREGMENRNCAPERLLQGGAVHSQRSGWMGSGCGLAGSANRPESLARETGLLHTERPAGLLTCSLQLPSSVRDSLSIYRREPSKLAALMAFYGKNSTPPPTATGMPSL